MCMYIYNLCQIMCKYSQIRNNDDLGRFCEHVIVTHIKCYRQLNELAEEAWQNY
jgi:hypothetical protein